MLDVEGFILVGGASSRMGADKSQLVFDGQTTIELIAEALRSLTTQVRLVGSRDESIKNAFPNLPDLHPSWGPLGGIHTALNACKAEWAAIVACDLPLVTGELFNRLSKFIDESEPRTCDAVVPIQIDARPQPLCALYRKDACLVATEQLIANGEH